MSDLLDFRAISDERCDRCCQRAVARLELAGGGVLYMCRHRLHVFFPETHVYEGIAFTYDPVAL